MDLFKESASLSVGPLLASQASSGLQVLGSDWCL